MISSDFRTRARKKMEGKWGKAACIVLAYTFVFFALGFVSGLVDSMNVLYSFLQFAIFIIDIPLAYGFIYSLSNLYDGIDVNAFDFLTLGFQNFSRAWAVFFYKLIKMIPPILTAVLFVLIMIFAIFGLVVPTVTDATHSAFLGFLLLALIGLIGYIVSLIWSITRGYYYALAEIVAIRNPNLSSKEAVEDCRRLMVNKRGKLFALQFTFIGWSIVATLGFGIGFLWVLPYIQFAMIAFYEFISSKDVESNVTEVNNDIDSVQ